MIQAAHSGKILGRHEQSLDHRPQSRADQHRIDSHEGPQPLRGLQPEQVPHMVWNQNRLGLQQEIVPPPAEVIAISRVEFLDESARAA